MVESSSFQGYKDWEEWTRCRSNVNKYGDTWTQYGAMRKKC